MTPALTSHEWAARIGAAWRQSLDSILLAGRLLSEAKEALAHGQWLDMIEELAFGSRTAQRLMQISADPRLANSTHASHLPPHWATLYELTRLDDAQFDGALASGTIKPDMQRGDISSMVKKQVRSIRELSLAAKQKGLPDKRYGVIYADPEWRFEPYSRKTGMDRAADNHYPTSATAEICQRFSELTAISADDCVLFLWATAPMLPDALAAMQAGNFTYRSHAIWRKDKVSTGYWFRNMHELLLVGTRGAVPAPAMGEQWQSVIGAEVGRHSEKPAVFYELIEAYYPNLPKIELNARRARPGWDCWGYEAPQPEAA